ncbi:hypothetical protein ccbrp13_02150 [Ktedonobacteria bacterium brp13]|nr:hypothetical protein ccbrp13_02150 [Ktedonobacteria bacterium brp13]
MSTRQRIPVGVMLIAGFYVFGALVLLISLFTNSAEVSRQIAERQGISPSIGLLILPLTAALALLIAYGLYALSTWGFFLTLLYLTYFGSCSFILGGKEGIQPYLGNLIWSLLVVIYLLIKRKHFFLEKKQQKYLQMRIE